MWFIKFIGMMLYVVLSFWTAVYSYLAFFLLGTALVLIALIVRDIEQPIEMTSQVKDKRCPYGELCALHAGKKEKS